ncbi:serine hydrolase domain-containing protein [Sphingorhabdus pulchriflava]|uniref:serine hydrolase domain-containing protein n=1 Tax=Sphingorhabdus pulchriflava TaxID=2292257 RepID=UPI0015F1B25E|nr:serine hydrolase domain-containing protein [Sphingorhabdus pulchriflava]
MIVAKAAIALAIAALAFAPIASSAEPVLPRPAVVRIDFDSSKILASRADGEAGVRGRAVSANDPVRVASISKLVTAIAVMRLVDQGRIDLDRDISEYLGFQIRNPAFPDQDITLRHLMTHTSGVRDKIDYLIPLDGQVEAVMTNAAAWDSKHRPGIYFSYANLNSPIIAATIEAATGERFDKLVAKTVLAPLKIDACFNWGAGCSPGRRAQAVTLLRTNGDLARDAAIKGSDPCPVLAAADGSCDLRRYPLGRNGSSFSPQGGLRISADDLAKVGQLMLNGGRPLLSSKAFAEMTRLQWRFNGVNGDDDRGYFKAYGLGVHIHEDSAGALWIGHVGEAYALRAGLWVNPETRKGFAQYVTMVPAETPIGHCLETCP